MSSLLPTTLVALLALGAPLHTAAPAAPDADAAPLACVDALEFLLALHDPGPGEVFVDVVEADGAMIATITRVVRIQGGSEELVMVRTTYVFPTTIYAHSSMGSGFNCDELE